MKESRAIPEAYNVLLDEPVPPPQLERLRAVSPRVRILNGIENIVNAHVVYTGEARFRPGEASRLRLVQLNTAGVGHLVGSALAKSGLPVANVRGAYTPPVAEFAIGLLLALARRLPVCHDLQGNSKWVDDLSTVCGSGLFGRNLAIVGYGNIGRHIARIAHAMGMRILACKRNLSAHRESSFAIRDIGDPYGNLPVEWFGTNEIETMFRATDHVMITLPFTPQTKNIIGIRELSALPSHALLVNIGRGEVLDEAALAGLLASRRLAGAALDVFAEEPLPHKSPLWTAPNTIITPHLGSYTTEQAAFASEVLIENVRRDIAGEPLLNLVDFTLGY